MSGGLSAAASKDTITAGSTPQILQVCINESIIKAHTWTHHKGSALSLSAVWKDDVERGRGSRSIRRVHIQDDSCCRDASGLSLCNVVKERTIPETLWVELSAHVISPFPPTPLGSFISRKWFTWAKELLIICVVCFYRNTFSALQHTAHPSRVLGNLKSSTLWWGLLSGKVWGWAKVFYLVI